MKIRRGIVPSLPHGGCGGKYIRIKIIDTSWVGCCNKCGEIRVGPPKNVPYQLLLQDGEYVCGVCKKKFPAYYSAKSIYWMGWKHITSTARSNFFRHLISCHKKKIITSIKNKGGTHEAKNKKNNQE